MNTDTFTCPTCGYTWKRGQSGNHYCSELLLERIKELERKLNPMLWTPEEDAAWHRGVLFNIEEGFAALRAEEQDNDR